MVDVPSDAPFPIFTFSTLTYPTREHFGVWVQDNHCDCKWDGDHNQGFKATAIGADFGSFFLAGRKRLNLQQTSYEIRRTENRIRTDGLDFLRFTLIRSGQLLCRQPTSTPVKKAGDLALFDAAQVNECSVEGCNDILSLVVSRDLLPHNATQFHSENFRGPIGSLLADHMGSLFANLSGLRSLEVPYIAQATLQLLAAAVSPTPDAIREAAAPIQDSLFRKIQRYIDGHLLEPGLTPGRICRDVGLSRGKLYQLFAQNGGVMHQVQTRRLRKAYHFLADPRRPRLSIAEVAWKHGFPNEKHFYRLFKSEFGHTPNETAKLFPSRAGQPKNSTFPKSSDGSRCLANWTLPYPIST